ncbi:hypothetical protein CMUS01_16258 [Colletotrichum musicola]|uniref:Rhodopsin domain-containing protein n=1 Tax=Colletotrichum musicola TaxID=2175873 RepID=A0A8H6MK25_9PEZI|nr:hypothetical protein CMUS01_16258 [Colletotrichum musicola]
MIVVDSMVAAQQIAESSTPALNMAQHRAIGINVAFIVFIVIIMGMRMWARIVITKAIGMDDNIPLDSMEPMLLAFFTSRVLYAISMFVVKIALLLFYLRLDNRPMMRWTVYGLTFVVVATAVAHIVIAVVECSPPQLFWTSKGDQQIYMTHCLDQATQQAVWDATGITVIVTDIILWICPIPMIWKLQLPKRQKWAVSAVFACGIISVFAGCVRFYYVRQLAHEPELYRQLADSLIWYALELHIAIFCGCSSALKVFFKRYFPSFLGSSSSRTKYPLDSQGNDRTKTTSSHPLASLSSRITGNQTIITATGRRGRTQIQESIGSSNSSEEAIMPNDRGIRMKTEFQQEVTRTSGDSDDKTSGTDKKAVSHVRSFVR